MSSNHQKFKFEDKIKKIELIWFLVNTILITIISITFFIILLHSYDVKQVITSNKQRYTGTDKIPNFSTLSSTTNSNALPFIVFTIMIYMVLILIIVFSTRKGRSLSVNKVKYSFFNELTLLKFNHSSGLITLDKKREIKVDWNDRGYFTIIYNSQEVAYAKSTELYWKILLVRNNVLNNGFENTMN